VTLYSISPLTQENAQKIINWRYQPPYDIYDPVPEDLDAFFNPEYRYHQVLDQRGELIGYCCYGADARVAGGDYRQGEPEVLDVGIGLKPQLTGQGLGKDFVGAVLKFARKAYRPEYFRVTVADFNQRSRKTFQNLGFKAEYQFIRELVALPFTQFERPASEDIG
jgi:ribosomal-protein-alanine N-acetyltransferase